MGVTSCGHSITPQLRDMETRENFIFVLQAPCHKMPSFARRKMAFRRRPKFLRKKVWSQKRRTIKAGGKYGKKRPYRVPAQKFSNKGQALVGGFSRGGMLPLSQRARLTQYNQESRSLTGASADAQVPWAFRCDAVGATTLTGQPRGHDQWMNFYTLNRVVSVKMTMTTTFSAISSADAASGNGDVVLLYEASGVALGSPPALLDLKQVYERKKDLVKRVMLSDTKPTIVSKTFTISNFELVKAVSARREQDEGWTTSGAAPTYESGAVPTFRHIIYPGPTAAVYPTVEVSSEIRLEFDCMFKRPIALAAS